MTEHLVTLPPDGLVLALQYWEGDEERALRLARLLADVEPRRRARVLLAFCRRFDMPEESPEAWRTRLHCGTKFGTIAVRAEREGTGHPDGCFGLWAGTLDVLAGLWQGGNLNAHSVFFMESDGVPLRADWLDVLLAEHDRTLAAGRRVTGAYMARLPHINGSLIAHLSLWHDRRSLHETPPGQAWDLFHAQELLAEARPTTWIKNVYGACKWSPESLAAMAKETAWLASQKDDSALAWAERELVAPRADAPEDGAGDEVVYPVLPRVSVHG